MISRLFEKFPLSNQGLPATIPQIPGRGAVWLARLTGGQEVAGSSPVAPIGIRFLCKNCWAFLLDQFLTQFGLF